MAKPKFKYMLSLLLGLVCNVAWAQTSYFKMGTSTTSLSDGNYVLVAMSDKGTGPVIYDPDAGEGKHYRYEAGKTLAAGNVVSSKYVWTIDETTVAGVQHIIVTNYDDNTKAFPADESRNQNFTGSGVASLLTEVKTIGETNYIALSRDIVVEGNTAQGYVHANAPGGNPCLSYWNGYGDNSSCVKFTFYPVEALTDAELADRLTYNISDGNYNNRTDNSSSSWRPGWTSTNVGKPSFTITAANNKNNMNAGSTEFIGMRPGDTNSCVYTLTLGERFTGYSFEAKSNNASPAHVITINGKETTISSTEWTTVRADVVGTTASFGLKGSNDHDLYIRNVKFVQDAEVFASIEAAVTANANMDIYGLQRYLGLVQNADKYECNYPSNPADGQGYPALIDGNYDTYFHGGYDSHNPGPDGVAHYLQADLGKKAKSFRFYFKKRKQNNANRPTKITIEGSNDKGTWAPVTVIASGFPTDQNVLDYYSEAITSETAYQYYRFTVNTTSDGTRFFTFSEFYILPNTPKVAETFDAVRGFRAGATATTATALNEVYAWHQGFTGDAYPNDLYEGVYTLTINGPAAATATYNGESKALPATFYVTEEVAEENAAVTIASTESTLSFNCFSDETDTYETLTVTSLTENKVYTANFNYSLELKESTGRFTEGSKVWSLTTNAANPVALTFTSNANNMNHDGGYIQLHSGQAKSSTYTLTVPEGYIILEYSFNYAFGNSGTGDKKFVVGGTEYAVTAQSQSLSVEKVNATTTQFLLTGENQPVKVQNFIVKVKDPTAKEIADAKKTAKDGVDANAAKLQQDLGYYSYTIGGAKVYTIDEVKAAIDAAATIVEVNAITASFALNVPEVGKFYRLAYDYGNNGGKKYLQSTFHSGENLALTDNTGIASIFYYTQVNNKKVLQSYSTKKYLKEDSSNRGLKDDGGSVTFSAGANLGKLKVQATSYLHANGGNNACYLDHCGSDGCAQHNFIIEEVNPITLTINAPGKLNVSATWNGETKTLPATWNTFEGVAITESTLRGAGNATYAFTGFSEGDQSLGKEVTIASLDADRTLTANFAPSFFGTTLAEATPVHIYNDNNNSYFIRLNATDGFAGKALNSGTCTYTESEMWYFVGTPENFKMYNHKAGADYAVKVAGTGGGSAATMALVAEATSLKLTLQIDGSYRIAPQAGDGNTGFNMYGGAGKDIALHYGDGSDWLFRCISKDALTLNVSVDQVWESSPRVAELTFTVNDAASTTRILGNVEGQALYLPVGATYEVSSMTYRGYTYNGCADNDGVLTASYTANDERTLYYNREESDGKPNRIPAIATAPNGDIFAISDHRPCGNDIGYGEVDLVCRVSSDNGATWTESRTIADGLGHINDGIWKMGFGDPAIVADRESNKVLVMSVCGNRTCWDGNYGVGGENENPNRVSRLYIEHDGEKWVYGEPEEVTYDIYPLFVDENGTAQVTSMFIGAGKICQSRVVKKGDYYRLYCAVWAVKGNRSHHNYVIYSDDFGESWNVLGNLGQSNSPAPAGNEPKCEELPDGTVVLSSRKGSGRYFNLFTFNNEGKSEEDMYTTGSWGTCVSSNNVTDGLSFGGNDTNGEIYKVKAIHNESGRICDVMLQSVPTGGGRDNVAIFYKEMEYNENGTNKYSPETFAQGWTKGKHVSTKGSAYSTMILQADGRLGFYFEEFPGDQWSYCLVYIPYTIKDVTGGAYSLYTVNSTISEHGIGTFYASEAMQIPKGVKAYVATTGDLVMNGDDGYIAPTELEGIIPANTGAILMGDAKTYNFIPSISYGTPVDGNMLVGYEGADEYEEVSLPTDGSTNYVLTVMNGRVGFYKKETGFNVYNNKAYLNVPGSAGARAIYFDFGGETGILETENGNVKTENCYDLSGRRVVKAQKGIYIVNGKKVVK